MKKNIKKVKMFQKTLICLIGILIFVLGIAVDRFMNTNADEINYEYQSDNIGYDSTNNSLNATNVKDAIDELYEKVGQCPSGYFCLTDNDATIAANGGGTSTILQAYMYDENNETTFCVNGEEETCQKTICYLSKNKNACASGTIIDYKVNDTETVRFHVLHDNGNTLTLQTQKNTVYNTAWQTSGDHRDGPQTIMKELNNVTNDWDNVLNITLENGMTEFNDGTSANNNCSSTSCYSADENYGYSYSTLINNESIGIGSTVKARMITITETAALGCTSSEKSCPIYLYNYLQDSISYCRVSGKCTNDTYIENEGASNYGYWTMGARYSKTIDVWSVCPYGRICMPFSTGTDCGARAVVVVDK